MLLRLAGKLAMAGAGMGGRAAWAVGSRGAMAGAGFAYGMGSGAVGATAGLGYIGYRALRGSGPMHRTFGNNPIPQLNLGIQSRLVGGMLGAGAIAGLATRDPGYRADFSPGGNLEVKGPAMLEATGDLALSLNRNSRRVSAPTQYGYMTTTTIPGNGRF